jgi:hypothetical protein
MTAPFTTNGHKPAPDLRAEDRQAWFDGALEGKPPSGAELGRRFGRSPQWGRMVAADARRAHQEARPTADRNTHVVESPGEPVAPAKPGLAPAADGARSCARLSSSSAGLRRRCVWRRSTC